MGRKKKGSKRINFIASFENGGLIDTAMLVYGKNQTDTMNALLDMIRPLFIKSLTDETPTLPEEVPYNKRKFPELQPLKEGPKPPDGWV